MIETSESVAMKLWRHVFINGGRWTRPELRAALNIKPNAMDEALYRLTRARHIERFKVEGQLQSYGFTHDCHIPKAVTFRELLSSGLLKEAA